jgi:V-type H+-transporting ATPase subunit H
VLQDLIEALNSVEESLRVNIKTLSSFDKYKQEVSSGKLEWTPVHKDPAFWRENVSKFEDNDFQVSVVN